MFWLQNISILEDHSKRISNKNFKLLLNLFGYMGIITLKNSQEFNFYQLRIRDHQQTSNPVAFQQPATSKLSN